MNPETTGIVSAETIFSTSNQPTATVPVAEQLSPVDKRITPEEALSRVMSGEELLWACCPNCNSTLAVYIRTDKVHVGVGPIVPVRPEPPSTDDTHRSSD